MSICVCLMSLCKSVCDSVCVSIGVYVCETVWVFLYACDVLGYVCVRLCLCVMCLYKCV